jgi:adenylate cyclase
MRVERWFAFVDLSGFTSFGDEHGDDESVRVLTAFRAACRTVATDFGVRIAKWLGDGCMVVAVDQPGAIAFALDLRERSADVCAPLTVRAGIASGYALLFEGDDYIGSSVNMASRLCDAADRSQVLIPAMGVERLPEGVVAVPDGTRQLSGFPGDIEVLDLNGTPAPAAHNDTGELWSRSPFL